MALERLSPTPISSHSGAREVVTANRWPNGAREALPIVGLWRTRGCGARTLRQIQLQSCSGHQEGARRRRPQQSRHQQTLRQSSCSPWYAPNVEIDTTRQTNSHQRLGRCGESSCGPHQLRHHQSTAWRGAREVESPAATGNNKQTKQTSKQRRRRQPLANQPDKRSSGNDDDNSKQRKRKSVKPTGRIEAPWDEQSKECSNQVTMRRLPWNDITTVGAYKHKDYVNCYV